MPRLRPAGLWIASGFDISSQIRVWAPDRFGRLTECHYFSFLHLWILASSKDVNRVCEYRHSVCHVGCDAAGSLGVVPLHSTLTPWQPLPKCSPVRLSVSSLKVAGGTAHLCHAELCPACVCPVALSAAEVEGERPQPVYWVVCGSVYWRGGWSGVPITRGSHAVSPGLRECYIVLPPAASQAAEAQGQHPWTLGWGWNSWRPGVRRSTWCSWKKVKFKVWDNSEFSMK